MSAAGDRLRMLANRAEGEAGRSAAEAGGRSLSEAMQHKLSQKSHPRGTPTPSAPGTPPAKISGALAGSVTTTGPTGGGGVWTAQAGPHGLVYMAIQNFGGTAGRGHHSHLPPRPYTAKDPDRAEASRRAAEAFHRAMGV